MEQFQSPLSQFTRKERAIRNLDILSQGRGRMVGEAALVSIIGIAGNGGQASIRR